MVVFAVFDSSSDSNPPFSLLIDATFMNFYLDSNKFHYVIYILDKSFVDDEEEIILNVYNHHCRILG